MGTMYKATLPNGWFVAEKRMHDSRHFEEHMVSELKTLGRLRHNNLLPLLGFCIESKERLLVYKYISNGNLFDWLHSVEAQKKILEWPLRVKIAVGVAWGLAWLHHGYNAREVHLNINSRSILLDRNFEPKLSNFGEAMLRISTKSSNSDFWEMAFVKEDVHGYGVRESELWKLCVTDQPAVEYLRATFSSYVFRPLWIYLYMFWNLNSKCIMCHGPMAVKSMLFSSPWADITMIRPFVFGPTGHVCTQSEKGLCLFNLQPTGHLLIFPRSFVFMH